MTSPLKKIFFALSALALLACTSGARSAEVLKILPGFALIVKVPGADKGKVTAIVGDPEIADFTYGPQNRFMIIGKAVGATNIVVLDDGSGDEIYNATVQVGAGLGMNVTVYAGMNEGSVYLCDISSCSPEKAGAKKRAAK